MQLDDPNVESQWLDMQPVGRPEFPLDHEAYLELIHSAGAVEAMWKWLPRISNGGTSFESYFEHMMKLTEKGRFFPMAIFDKTDNAYMGGASFLRPSRTHRSVEIGFVWLKAGYQDWKNFAALQEAMIRRAMGWRAKRISWHVSTTNERMLRAMDRLGVKQEGVLRSVFRMNDGCWGDMAVYALVQDEIPQMLEHIGKMLEEHF